MTCYVRYPSVQDITGVPETGYAPFYFAPASEGGSTLPFHFTDESFTRVLSALVNGAFMTYGPTGEAHQVIWDFLVNVEYPVSFCDQVAQAILTCDDVQAALATVIGTSEPIQDAITQTVINSDEFNNYVNQQVIRLTQGQVTGKLTGGDCDNSVVAGQVIAIVERLNTNNVDFFEILEVGTNDEERVSSLLSAIPGLNEAPFDEIIDIAQSLLENLSENYAAAITEGWKDEVEEDLYCLARQSEDCSLTYQQVFEYFRDRCGASITIGSLISDVINFVINGDFDTDELIASGMYTIQLGFILTGTSFNGLRMPSIGAIMRDATPSSAWEGWDECPSNWCRSFTGADLQSAFTPTGGLGPQASWTGTGYGANSGLINSRITLEADLGSTVVVEDILVVYSGTPTPGAINTVTMYAEHFGAILGSAAWILETAIDITGTSLQKFDLDTISSFDTSVPITVEIVEIRVQGTGTPPSIGTPC